MSLFTKRTALIVALTSVPAIAFAAASSGAVGGFCSLLGCGC